jgi:alkylation response protein AidB-like acyl-CoA dehydrogenase
MSMIRGIAVQHYRSNLRDLEFNLLEVLRRDHVLGAPPYTDLDAETARDMLAEADRLARNVLARSLIDSDRNPPSFDPRTGAVTLPPSFKESFHAYMDAEWWRMDVPEALGGISCPPSLRWAIAELILGANPAVHMYGTAPGFAGLLHQLGTPVQKRIARHMVERGWGATMVLTEPEAGSDVGAARTTAVPQPDGSWHLTGVKRFISSGEHDLADNIVHFVLARPQGAPEGTKGLSLFIVPKFLVDLETGEPTARNGVYATNVEHKMGLKVSATCELRFGENHPAAGWLVGGVHDGIAQMFLVIGQARMMVGTKAVATLSSGYLNALDFARNRVQGRDLARILDRKAPRVTIIHHPEVRRSLLLQKGYAEGMRALVLYTASVRDETASADHLGSRDERAEARAELLLPIVKGYCSERSYEQLTQALQVLGGSGYLQDYPIEQYLRDSKVDTLYEGTTAIQGQDYFFRKIVRDQGSAFTGLITEIQEFAKSDSGGEDLAAARDHLLQGTEDLQAILATMVQRLGALAPDGGGDPGDLYQAGQNTTRLLMASGDVVVAWLLLSQAAVALDKLPAAHDADRAFYQGKVAAAKFFAGNVLPMLASQRAIAEGADPCLMTVTEEAF